MTLPWQLRKKKIQDFFRFFLSVYHDSNNNFQGSTGCPLKWHISWFDFQGLTKNLRISVFVLCIVSIVLAIWQNLVVSFCVTSHKTESLFIAYPLYMYSIEKVSYICFNLHVLIPLNMAQIHLYMSLSDKISKWVNSK